MYTRAFGAAICLAAIATVSTRAQQPFVRPADATSVRFLAVGNFLGQLDGFCEDPGGTYDLAVPAPHCAPGGPGASREKRPATGDKWPAALGGVLGAGNWLKSQQNDTSLLLLTGNNQPADYSFAYAASPAVGDRPARSVGSDTAQKRSTGFWREVQNLNPAVVALGPEDFIRSLRNPPGEGPLNGAGAERASQFVEWIRSKSGLPFLASNAVVKIKSDHLNRVEDGDYELEIAKNESVDWVESLTLSHPANALMTITLEESDTVIEANAPAAPIVPTLPAAADSAHTKISIIGGSLRPGKYYRVRVTAEGKTHTMTFRTHKTLMADALRLDPRVGRDKGNQSASEVLAGFPVAVAPVTRPSPSVPLAQRDDILILSLVAPSTGTGLGERAWAFRDAAEPVDTEGQPAQSVVAFTSPSSAVAAILRRLAAAKTRTPYVVLLSDLDDEDTLDVIDTYPEIRAVILPPESVLLGRAARATDDNKAHLIAYAFSRRPQINPGDPSKFSGDLGLATVIDADRPPAARMIARPEWVGETGARLDAALARNAYGEWEAHEANARVNTIPGIPLAYDLRAAGLFYYPAERRDLEVGPYKPYLAPTTAPDDRANFLAIWQNTTLFANVAGHALRTSLLADVAVVPQDLYDPDMIEWLGHALKDSNGEWLSRFILERAMFRSYRYVRADVSGANLLDKMQKAVGDPLETGSKGCVSGMGAHGCPTNFDKEHPERVRVRDRAINQTLFYNVATPDGIAEKLELEHKDEIDGSRDALTTMDSYLADGRWVIAGATPKSMTSLLENRANNESRSYLNIRTLDLGVTQILVGEPDGREGVLANLPVDFKGAERERTLAGKIDLELAREGPKYGARFLHTLDVSKRRIIKKDPVPDVVTYPKDALFAGARLERRLRTDGGVEWRFYGGGFFEGPTRETQLKPVATRDGDQTRDGFKTQEKAAAATPLIFPPSQYRYGAVGIDALPAAKDIIPADDWSATISKASVDVAYGSQSSVLTGLKLGGVEQSLNDFLAKGPQKLLDEYFVNNLATFNADVAWDPRLESRRQGRVRLTLEGELGYKRREHTYKATLSLQYNLFRMADAAELALANSAKFTSDFKVPLWWRFELVPAYEVQRARIRAKSKNTFWSQRFVLRANLPLFVRFGAGNFAE